MGNANPRYLRAWPAEQLATGGGAALVYGTPAELLAGVDPLKVYSAAALASASVAGITAGAGDAGKFLRLDGVGKIAPDVVATATATEIQAGAATGVTDAATLAIASVKSFGSMADDGKYVRVTNSGKVDLTLLPIATALVYRGTAQPVSTAPAGPVVGDVYILNAGGTFDPTWGALSGTPAATGDQLIYDGTNWNLIGATSGGTVNSVGAGNGLLGGPITTAGVLSINYGTATDLMSGTDTVKLYNAATLAAASTVASAGAADAGKFIKLDPTGKIDASMLPPAGGTGTVTNIATGAGLTGGPITTTGTIDLAASGATAGTYRSVTVDTYGRVTAGTNPTTLAGYGITDAVPNTASVSGGTSLTGGGALSGSPLTITLVNDAAAPGAAKYYGTDGAGVKGWQTFPAAGGTGTVTNVATGAGLTGGPINTTGTISLAASGVTAGTSGSATAIPVVTVDTYGRITGITTQTVTPAWTDVTGKPTTVAASGLTDAVASTRAITGATSLTGGGDLTADRTISLVNDAAAPGNSMYYGTDAAGVKGYFALPAGGGGGAGTVTSVATGVGLTGGPITSSGTISLATSGVTAGTYNAVTVDAYGRVTAGTNPSTLSGHGITDGVSTARQIIAGTGLTGGGDLTADRTLSLANSGVTAGTYKSVTVDAMGRVTAGTNPTTLAGYGITDAVASTRAITGTTSLTGGGDLTADRTIALVNDAAAPGNNFFYGTDAAGAKGWRDLSGLGYVVGPATATDNAIARYDATTGKLIQNSGVIIDDTDNVSGVNSIAVTANANFSVTPSTGIMDLAVSQMFTATATANTTWDFQNVPAGRGVVVTLRLTNGGAFTQTWPGSVTWEGGTVPTLQSAGTDVIKFVTHDGGTTWYGHSLTAGSGASAKPTLVSAQSIEMDFGAEIGKMVSFSVATKFNSAAYTDIPAFYWRTYNGTTWSIVGAMFTVAANSLLAHQYGEVRFTVFRESATLVRCYFNYTPHPTSGGTMRAGVVVYGTTSSGLTAANSQKIRLDLVSSLNSYVAFV